MKPQKLKRVCIKEELVALTGHFITALILNQLIYWSERTKDTDKFLEEELTRNPDLDIEFLHGWIFKKADELINELMLDISAVTLRRYISRLVEQGLVHERRNPHQKQDKTLQYRPNIVEIQSQLQALGYALEGYPLKPAPSTNLQNEGCLKPAPSTNLQNEVPTFKNRVSTFKNEVSTIDTEITPEITPEISKESLSLTLSLEPEPEEREREFLKPKSKAVEPVRKEAHPLDALNPDERESFEKFVRTEWQKVQGKEIISFHRFMAMKKDFDVWHERFLKSAEGRKAKEEAIAVQYDWENHPDLENLMRARYYGGVPWTQEVEAEREFRTAFFIWSRKSERFLAFARELQEL